MNWRDGMMDCRNNIYKENFMKKIIFLTTFIVFNLVFSDFKSEIKRRYNNRIIDLSTISELQYKIIAEYKYKKNNNQKSIFF